MDIKDIPQYRLYNDLAFLWPYVSRPEEYAEEAGIWRAILRERLGEGRHSILELGVGGGHNLSHLAGEFEATAVDPSDAMLAHCAELNPGVELHKGDMRNVRLGRKFDVVLIHDAISYMLTEDDLRATFETAAAHLESGGLFITGPDWFAETFHPPVVDYRTISDAERTVTKIEYLYDSDPTDTQMETLFTYIIRTAGDFRVEHDRHTTGLFSRPTWLRLMQETGFTTELRPFKLSSMDRAYELFVGIKESD